MINNDTEVVIMKQRTQFPRSLEQAFGPYQRHGLVEQPDPMPAADKIVVGVGIVALVILFVLIALGWLPGGVA